MDDNIFTLCELLNGPITEENYLKPLAKVLGEDEVPATITRRDIEQIRALQEQLNAELNAENDEESTTIQEINNEEKQNQLNEAEAEEEEEEEDASGGTTPLHSIVNSVDPDISGAELDVVLKMIDMLFEWGAGWMILDENNETPGCIAFRRKLPKTVYEKIVSAGVRAEVFLSRMTEDSDDDESEGEQTEKEEKEEEAKEGDTAQEQDAYLNSQLEYTDHNLITRGANDGVMMDWEDPIMKRSAALITTDSGEDGTGPVVLNVGFGMGIIDGYIQGLKPKRHFICEAHPQVLSKMKADGWYEKPGVTVLEGPWKETLPKLLETCGRDQMYFDGLYYDTFSEHYRDLVEFLDFVVGIMKPTGTFSFFNGLGADRQVCYDVYKQVVEVDLGNYGLEVAYQEVEISPEEKTWEGIRKQYWALKKYSLPVIKFM